MFKCSECDIYYDDNYLNENYSSNICMNCSETISSLDTTDEYKARLKVKAFKEFMKLNFPDVEY